MRKFRFACGVTAIALATFILAGPAWALPKLDSAKFQQSSACGCHAGLLEEWSVSMHAKALTDPLYRYQLDEAIRATDGALGPYCEACHAPVAVMSGEIANLKKATPQSVEGITCDFCHQVTGTTTPIANVSQKLNADGTKRAQYDDSNSPAHPTEYSAFHQTAEFCGACHNVDHPGNGMHLESTYTEWKNGPYAEKGIVCQDCHMTPGPGVRKPYPGSAAAGGPQRDHIYLMTFAGGNVGLGDAARAEERLKAAATLDMQAPEIVAPGSQADVEVTITNVGAGHYLPTGLTEVRQMWLEVTAEDPSGGSVVIGTHRFDSILEDAKGDSPVPLWDAVKFAVDDRIPPKGSVTDTFQLTMPESGEVTLTAALYYRSCTEELAKEAKVDIPTTTMVTARQAVFGSEAIKTAAAKRARGHIRIPWALVALAGVGVILVVGLLAMMRRKRASHT